MRLTAYWRKDQDTAMEEPYCIRWGNGTVATLDDYRQHQLDTHNLKFNDPDWIQLDMYPDIVAQVGIVGHYTPARISLDGFVLDPQLSKAA